MSKTAKNSVTTKSSMTVRRKTSSAPGKKSAAARSTSKVPTKVDVPDTTEIPLNPDAPVLRKGDLIDQVVSRSGIKKRDAKLVLEAILKELGEALSQGRPVSLPPLGRIKITRAKSVGQTRVYVARIRQNETDRTAAEVTTASE